MKAFRTLIRLLDEWLLWIVVVCVGWCVGLVMLLVVACGASYVLPDGVSLVVSTTVAGAMIGYVQRWFLRPATKRAAHWLLASATGWTAGLVTTALLVNLGESSPIDSGLIEPMPFGVVGVILGGCALGCTQLLALRAETKGRAEWVLVTVAGWTAAVALGIILTEPSPDSFPSAVMEIAAAGAVGLVILGLLALVARIVLFPDGRHNGAHYVRWWP